MPRRRRPSISSCVSLNAVTRSYLYGNGRLAQYQTAMQYFGADGLGSVRQLHDASGEVVGSSRYDPYGNVMSYSGDATSVFGFTGELFDAATGLEYLRARYYSSAPRRSPTPFLLLPPKRARSRPLGPFSTSSTNSSPKNCRRTVTRFRFRGNAYKFVLVMVVTGLLWAVVSLIDVTFAGSALAALIGIAQPMWFMAAFSRTVKKSWLLTSGILLSIAIPYGVAATALEATCRILVYIPLSPKICAGEEASFDYIVVAVACTLVTALASLVYSLYMIKWRASRQQ